MKKLINSKQQLNNFKFNWKNLVREKKLMTTK